MKLNILWEKSFGMTHIPTGGILSALSLRSN